MTHQRGPIALANCNLWFEHSLITCSMTMAKETHQTASNISNWLSLSLSLSSSPVSQVSTSPSFFILSLHIPFFSLLGFFLLSLSPSSMDRSEKHQHQQQQQQLSLAKSSRHRCSEWFV